MAKITIGGEQYIIPEMNFLAIERAWPFVQEATDTLDPIKGVSAALAVFAAAIMEAEDFSRERFNIEETATDDEVLGALSHFFKKTLKGSEVGVIRETMFEVLKEAGLEITEGEAIAALTAALATRQEEPIPSPETAPDTSLSSSLPESREEVGTE